MKNRQAFLFLAALALSGMVAAGNLLINGDFEDPAGTGWGQWWSPGNSNRYVPDPLNSANHCAGVWWIDDGIIQDVAIGSQRYVFGGDVFIPAGEPLSADRVAIIVAEVHDGFAEWWREEIIIYPTDPTGQWVTYSGVIENTLYGAPFVTINLFMVDYGAAGTGIVFFDNMFVAPEGHLQKARNPVPSDGAEVGYTTLTQLGWTNPEPANPSDTIVSNVYFAVGSDPGNLSSVATGISDNVLNLAGAGITLQDDSNFVWRVDSSDSGTGITTTGDVWTFTTGDAPPIADAGDDQYLVLADGARTFTLTGSYIDDGKSTVTTLWSLNPLTETDPATLVTIHSPNALVTEVTVNNTGWFYFDLTATDNSGSDVDTVNVGVYGTCALAATEDPNDNYDATGDFNGDCKIDMADFAIFAARWLDCNTNRPEDVVCP